MPKGMGPILAVSACAILISGCANAPLPSLSVSSISAEDTEKVPASSTEVYARLARGAFACWFGKSGPLKAQYVYSADAQPASRGGVAEILIHKRDTANVSPRGAKVFRVRIEPAGETAKVGTENISLPDDLAQYLSNDVQRWSTEPETCSQPPPTAAWAPITVAPAPVTAVQPAPKTAKQKKKAPASTPAKKPI